MQLARLGMNVVIMSRSKDKLQKVADEISTYKINDGNIGLKVTFFKTIISTVILEK
jgi:NADP-dependent 3-hydroxy acid dehydrogenase YdfG